MKIRIAAITAALALVALAAIPASATPTQTLASPCCKQIQSVPAVVAAL